MPINTLQIIKFRRKTLNKLKTFIFYDEYLDALNTLSDEKTGRMIKRICKFIYTDEPLEQLIEADEKYAWSCIEELLPADKEFEVNGTVPRALMRDRKYFYFQENFYLALDLMTDSERATYIKAICAFMFLGEDKPKLKPPIDAYFNIAKRKLELSKIRKTAGSKGGKTKKTVNVSPTESEPITIEKLKTEFNLYGNLNENNPILQGVDLKKLREFILNNYDVKTQSTYRIVEKFRQANGITT